MKTLQQYSFALLMLLIPVFGLANNGDLGGKYTEQKTFNKNFDVSKNATVKVNNSYGNLDVVTWDQNRVEMVITITTNGDDLEAVKEKLNDITVDFNASSDYVSAKTIFPKSSKSWWSWGKKNKVHMKINYLIKMPKTNNIDFNNDYGSINLDTTQGDTKIVCDYGKITTKELLSSNNDIRFDYTNNSYFEFIKKGIIRADYSGYTVSKTEDLEIMADYTKTKIEIAENVKFNCDYGGLNIEKANNIDGRSSYLTTQIGDIYKTLSLNADYGSIKIDNVATSASSIIINSDYVGVKIGVASNANFDFEFDLGFGSLKHKGEFEFSTKRVDSFDKFYKGYVGRENSGNTIKVSADYGSINIYQN
jgi:hypothetical protein